MCIRDRQSASFIHLFSSPLYWELDTMDTNHCARAPIPEIYTSSTKYFKVRDKKGYVSRTRKIPDDRKIFSRMECGWRNENCLRLRSRYRCGSERSEFLIDASQKKGRLTKSNEDSFHSVIHTPLHFTWFTYNCYTESHTPQPVDLTPIPQLLPYM